MRKLILLSSIVIGPALAGAASAQDLRDQQVLACTGDAMRLCSEAIPDEGRVTACMEIHRASLSAGCLAVFRAANDAGDAQRPTAGLPQSNRVLR